MEPFIGEIRLFAGNFAPYGWALCNGALVQISDNATLYNLIGTTYGGDSQTTFRLPDLQSRVPMHAGSGAVTGQIGGSEAVTLTTPQLPAHNHIMGATSASNAASPANALPALATVSSVSPLLYGTGKGKPVTLSPQSVTMTGGNLSHAQSAAFRGSDLHHQPVRHLPFASLTAAHVIRINGAPPCPVRSSPRSEFSRSTLPRSAG